jgi:hypothetical protein
MKIQVALNSKTMFLVSLFFFIFAVFIFYFQNYIASIGIHNFVFPDGFTIFKAVQEFIEGKRDILSQRAAWLMPLFYSLPTMILGSFGVILFNHILFYIFFRLQTCNKMNIVFLIFFSLFYWLSAFMPNKEIPILIFTAVYLNLLYKKKFLYAFFIAILTTLIRDGHGVFLILFTLMLLVKFPIRLAIVLIFVFAYSIDSYLNEIADATNIFALTRTIDIVDSLQKEILPYVVRIFGNITNLGSRSIIFEPTHMNIIGLGFYLAGFGIFFAFLFSVYDLLIKYKKNMYFDNVLAGFFILSVLVFSISPLVQPRYLIPIAFLYLINSTSVNSNKKYFVILLIVTVITLLMLRVIYLNTIGLPKTESFFLDDGQIFYEGKLILLY